jgi:hypothetical protein
MPVPLWEVNQFPQIAASFWCMSCHRHITALNILELDRSLGYYLPLKCDMMARIIEANRKPDNLNTAYRALRLLELYAGAAGDNAGIALRSRKIFNGAKARADKYAVRRRS